MAEPEPRYSFDPLERRGVLLGLQAGQLVTMALAAVLALAADRALGHPGLPVAVLILVAGVAGAVWTKRGRPASAWAVELLGWLARHAGGPQFDAQPLEGRTTGARSRRAARTPPARTAPAGIELVELSGEPGGPIGVVVDRRHGRWIAVVQVAGGSFALLDPPDQARRLEGWRVALNSLGRPGTAVSRVQWIERSRPEPVTTLLESSKQLEQEAAGSSAIESYRDLVVGAKPSQHHECWTAIAVEGPAATGSPNGRKAEQVLRRELRLLEGRLRNADLLPSAPLDLSALVSMIGSVYETPSGHGAGLRDGQSRSAWPIAEDEQWSHVHSGAELHSTYWIADWPRFDVGPDFLVPLLMSEGRRTVSVVMQPVAPERAAREVRSSRTADAADEQLRSRAGFLPSARRTREAEGVMRREAELAEGHAEFRYSGYVTVHAADRESLDLACAEAEHAAQAAQLELRRLYGRQREALSWTLPLGRGLR